MALRFRSIPYVLLASGLFVACMPATDRDRYAVGDPGTATLRNPLPSTTLYLGGCGHFGYEKRVGGRWVAQAPDFVCVWEGYAEPVLPGEVVIDPIVAREPGTWRLRYSIGTDCSENAPQSQCARIHEVVSNRFEVVAGGCVVTGCSGQVCAEEPVGTTCEWLPHYACYQDARCGHFGASGACGWEPTSELTACLESNGANFSPKR